MSAEIHGLPPDPHCLHCQLAPMLQTHLRTHPRKLTAQVVGELLQTVAELIASTTSDVGQDIDDAQRLIRELTREAFAELRHAGRRT
jgi:hypothetical protein